MEYACVSSNWTMYSPLHSRQSLFPQCSFQGQREWKGGGGEKWRWRGRALLLQCISHPMWPIRASLPNIISIQILCFMKGHCFYYFGWYCIFKSMPWQSSTLILFASVFVHTIVPPSCLHQDVYVIRGNRLEWSKLWQYIKTLFHSCIAIASYMYQGTW